MRRASVMVVVFVFLLSACGGEGQATSDGERPSDTGADDGGPFQTADPSSAPVGDLPLSVSDLARAVVYIEVTHDRGVGGGSGTLINPDGLILTNAHVAAPFSDGRAYTLSVGLTTDAGLVPEANRSAELLAADQALDLALIKIDVSDVSGLTYLPIGDSNAVEIGEDVHILGYPGIGGDTITYTRGQISGFTGDALLGDRAWIKTDAVISGGNSGGLAANLAGELIAVPTQASASTDGQIVDCRVVTDTNDDGVIDDADTCVPIGGFLNGLRPAVFAQDMIAAVESGVAYEPIGGLPQSDEEQPQPDTEDVDWSHAVMTSAIDRSTDIPTDDVESLPSGAGELCAVWEFSGMTNGLEYDAVWLVDGELDPELSFLGQTWAYGEDDNYWVCIPSPADGFYVAAVLVEGQVEASGWAFIGDAHAPVRWALRNGSSETFCYIYVSPDVAPGWGWDRLGSEDVLASGSRLDLSIPPGEYNILIEDCDGRPLYEGGASVSEGETFEISD